MLKTHFILILICSCLFACRDNNDNVGEQRLPETVSYNFHIRPILSDKCFACHGPDANKRQANFRLDIKDSAYAPLKETKGAFAIVPGKPEESEIFRRVSSIDPAYQMPTPESHLAPLTKHEITLIKKWIQQGGKYERHWAFVAPIKSPLPEVKDKIWIKNEIDHFTFTKMEE